MKHSRGLIVSMAFVSIALLAAWWLYPQLPAQTATHWNLHGQVDGSMPRFWAAAMPVLMILALTVLMWLLPAISPRRFEIKPFARVYEIVMLVVQGAMLVIGMAALMAGAGYRVPIPTIAMLSTGVLLMVMGNYMGKLRKNFFIGIRTPWTLASDTVWERTHRLAGRLFVMAGLIVLLGTVFGLPFWIGIGCLLAAVLIPALYSLVIYRRVEGASED